MRTEELRVYVCHARADHAMVDSLKSDLEDFGMSAWVDQLLVGGQAWWDQILERIRESDVFLFAVSPASLNSQACRLELQYAVAVRRQLLPVLVADAAIETWPRSLAEVQGVDYRDRTANAVIALGRAASSMAPTTPLPKPLPAPPAVPMNVADDIDAAVLSDRDRQSSSSTSHPLPADGPPPAGSPFTVFISYRREDSEDVTGRIRDRLKARFGPSGVFMDIDSIPPGIDFRKHISAAVASCDVVLVVIGRKWLDNAEGVGRARIHDDRDFVRQEIRSALAREIATIPILVQHATPPAEDDVPEDIKDLVYRTGLPVRPGADFDTDVTRLIGALVDIAKALDKPTPQN
ncbi:MAG TPA: toll/interleukin-1 receptor domain-containing protein [Ilumatobacteraceae bacterium]|nr:toll/interleukin-1 receptor domain-containing protein [Ilumatobacteraceae bacterium]